MNRDDIIRMAKEAGPLISTPFDEWCERFAALVAAAAKAEEQEECAKVCDERAADYEKKLSQKEYKLVIERVEEAFFQSQNCAYAIRTRNDYWSRKRMTNGDRKNDPR